MSGVLGTVPSTIPGFSTNGTLPNFPSGSTYTPTPSISSGSGITDTFTGIASIASAVVEVLAVMVMISLVGVIIIAVVANRADPDPSGRRPQSVYFFLVSFITITTAILGSAFVVAAILGITAHHSPSTAHALARLILFGALLTLVSVLLFGAHLRRGLLLARAEPSPSGPSRRVGQSYVAIVTFVAILVVLVTAVLSVYLLFALGAPGSFGSFGGRAWTVRILIETVYLGVVAVVVAWRHSSLLTPGLNIWGRDAGGPGSYGPPPLGVPPAPVPPLA